MIFKFVLACFACYRLSQLVSIDDGPFYIFMKLRLWAADHSKTLSELAKCPFCLGVWFSALITPLVFIDNIACTIILVFLAIAGAQSFLQSRS